MPEQIISLGYLPLPRILHRIKIASEWWLPKYVVETDKPEDDLNYDDIVVNISQIKVIIDYPLHNPASFIHNSETGFTRKDLIKLIAEDYQTVYEEEEQTTQVASGNIPGLLNRGETNGKYGIWGHHIEDLVLHTAYFNDTSYELRIGVDS